MEKYYEDLVKIIKEQYSITFDISSIWIERIDQYPHMFIIHFPTYNLIAKLINKTKINCKNINVLYNDLENNKYVELPQKTINGDYSILYDDKIVLVYRQLSDIKINPNSMWWSECLSSIHSIRANSNYFKTFSNGLYDETLRLLQSADIYMDEELKTKAYSIFSKAEHKFDKLNTQLALCHNDPYNLNVLQYKKSYKIIDTDGMGLSPKEFDIQRLLYNYAITCNNINNLELFWNQFKSNYENITNNRINLELLKNIYSCDLIRSLSWLFIVSNSKSRLDRNRQSEQLELYKNSLSSDIHLKILKKI